MDKSLGYFMSYGEIENAYRSLKFSTFPVTLYAMSFGIVTVWMVVNIVKNLDTIRDAKTNRVDMRALFSLCTPYIIGSTFAVAVPAIISLLEYGFAQIGEELMSQVPISKADTIEKALREEMVQKASEDSSFLSGFDIVESLELILITIVKPTMFLIEQWLFGIATAGRFLYLMLLEVVAPLAVCSAISKNTESYFYTWCKHMLACYLLLPAFALAVAFADAMRIPLMNGGTVSVFALLGVLILKLYLIKVAGQRVFQLI